MGTHETPTPINIAVPMIVIKMMKRRGPVFVSKSLVCWEMVGREGRGEGEILDVGPELGLTACCVGVEVAVAVTVMTEGVTISVVWVLRLRARRGGMSACIS